VRVNLRFVSTKRCLFVLALVASNYYVKTLIYQYNLVDSRLIERYFLELLDRS